MELVVEQAAFTADQMDVEVIGLKAIDDRRHLSDPAVLKPQNRYAGCWVFVFSEVLVRRMGGIGTDRFDLGAHAQQQCIQRVATGRKQAAASGVPAGVPAKLP